MSIGTKPPAEIAIDEAMVRALLREQHPDLAHLSLTSVGEGWDNHLFRLGDELAVRMPRRAVAVALIENEQRWLPLLSTRLPLAVPAVRRIGRPGCGFPWPWSITSWLPGRPALSSPLRDPSASALRLGQFVRALHHYAPKEAPHNPWRGVPLSARTEMLRAHIEQVSTRVDSIAVLELWDRCLSTGAWPGPPVWIHGDLHPGNLLVDDGRLSAVVDFGDLSAGDPATDLAVMWMLLPQVAWPAFVTSASGELHASDPDLMMRARGWAVVFGLAYLANSRDDARMSAVGTATLTAACGTEPTQSPDDSDQIIRR